MDDFWIFLAVAALVTSVLAGVGFNRPSWLRTYTTAVRYYDAMLVLMFLYVLAMLLVAVPVYGLRNWIDMDEPAETAVACGFLFALLVRAMPWSARRMHEWTRQFAGMPATGRAFAAALAEENMQPPASVEQEIAATLLSRGIDLRQDWLPPVRPVHVALRQATGLFLQLRGWEKGRCARFLGEARNDFDALRQQFDRLLLRVATALNNIDKVGKLHHLAAQAQASQVPLPGQADALVKAVVDSTACDLREDVRQFYRDACLFAVRGVMATYWTPWGRRAALRRLGFEKADQEPRRGYGMAVFQSLLLFFFACWGFVTMGPDNPAGMGNLGEGGTILLSTVLVLASITLAVLPKRRWAFANAGLRRKAPVGFIVFAGLAMLPLGALLAMLVGGLLIGGVDGHFTGLRASIVMLPSVVLMTMATAWLVQDHRWGSAPDWRKRCQDAAVFSGTWVVGTLVWAAMRDSPAVAQWSSLPLQPFLGIRTVSALVFAVTLGSIIGFAVPHLARTPAPRAIKSTAPEERAQLLAEVARIEAGFADSGFVPPIHVRPAVAVAP